MAVDPITAISAVSAIAGLAQSLLNTERSSPEYMEALQRIKKFADVGYGEDFVAKLQQKLKRSLGEEFSALSGETTQRLALGGASPASIQAALNRLQSKRQKAIGSAVTTAQLENEQAKLRALQALLQGSAALPYSTGKGGAELFSTGLLGLLMNLGKNKSGDSLPQGITVENDFSGGLA